MSELFTPYIQAGFAGLCFVLVGVIVWLTKQVLGVLRETNQVIEKNTTTIEKMHTSTARVESAIGKLRDELLRRPCVAEKYNAGAS